MVSGWKKQEKVINHECSNVVTICYYANFTSNYQYHRGIKNNSNAKLLAKLVILDQIQLTIRRETTGRFGNHLIHKSINNFKEVDGRSECRGGKTRNGCLTCSIL